MVDVAVGVTLGLFPDKPLSQIYVMPALGVVAVFKILVGFVQFTVVNVGVIVTVGCSLSTFMVTVVTFVHPFAAVAVTL